MRKSARLRMSEGDTLRDRCRVLAEAGFDGVDIVTPSDLDVDELRDAAADAGIAVANVLAARSLRWMLADTDAEVRAHGREGLELSLRDAAAVGATSVMVPSLLPEGVDVATARANTVAELERVVPLAAELGVRIAIENCWGGFLPTVEDLVSFVDGFDSPWIVVHFDTGNAQPSGAPEQWIAVIGSRIHKVDVKDWSSERAAEGGIDFGIELGEGECDWRALGDALRAIGYGGWLSAEVPGSGRDLLLRCAAVMDTVAA